MRLMLKITIAGVLFTITSSAMATSPDEDSWSLKLVNYFEMYCYQTDANLPRITSMADALGLQEIPQGMLSGIMPINDVEEGKGYVLEHDDVSQKGIIMMAVSGQDACSIIGANIEHESAIEYVLKEYQMIELFKHDVGLQSTTLYIPGGESKATEEAYKKGVVAIVNNKPGSISNGITISFLPPRTAQEIY